MTWKTVRIELGRTPAFPNGSDTHAYVFRIPVDENDLLDREALEQPEQSPVVRRFWPGERDSSGVVIATPKGWAFSYGVGEDDDEIFYHLENHPIRVGEYLTITEHDGEQYPFRIVSCHE
jgi:hypothetical protein